MGASSIAKAERFDARASYSMVTWIGATTSLFPFNHHMVDYLIATKRSDIANYAKAFQHNLQADKVAEYNQSIKIVRGPLFFSCCTSLTRSCRTSLLEPHINGPSPPIWLPLSRSLPRRSRRTTGQLSSRLLSSVCTNSSYEDLLRYHRQEGCSPWSPDQEQVHRYPRSVRPSSVTPSSRLSLSGRWSCLGQRVRSLYRSVGSSRRREGRAQLHHHLVQP